MKKTKPVKKTTSKTTTTTKKATVKKSPKFTQLSARVTGPMKNRTRAYAKANGLKLSHLVTQSLVAFMDAKPTGTVANA